MPQNASPEAGRQKTILVVEDDADLREALCRVLEEEGYRAVGRANGREALDYLRGEPAPCLVLLDLLMPVMSGWEFREEQMKDPRLSAIPVIVLSAHVKADLFGKSLGVDNYLKKPLALDELLALVARHCA